MGRFKKDSKIILSPHKKQFFDGIVAGDGCICNLKRYNRYIFTMCGKYYEFIKYVRDYFNFNTKIYKYKINDSRMIDGYFITYSFKKENIFFDEQYFRWYKDGRKIIPDDFEFGPVSMLSLYLCDGGLHKSGSIQICVENFFTQEIQDMIINNLNNVGVDCWINKRNRVYISAKSKNRFLNYIGDCPVNCYLHKWNHSIINSHHKIWTDRIRNGMSTKLSHQKASDIRVMYANGDISISKLSKIYDVNHKTVRDVVYNITWPDNNYDNSLAIEISKKRRYRRNI